MMLAIIIYLLGVAHNFLLDGALSEDPFGIAKTNWWLVLARSIVWPFVTLYMLAIIVYYGMISRFQP